ncbi:hypothetical protein E2562_024826 [Oryza meyeriana var. granulata]|uniref:Uncharacterized protein n=1 Tax=Oryza meyeriana var. granulata TaxID=110450 RepID=A0A6G1FBV5_9ORYZ|nr:hypothetical protein E2562_024826 [Oryza meyeriana var. granulata]
MALGGKGEGGIAVTALTDLFATWGLGVGQTWRALCRRRQGTSRWLRLRGGGRRCGAVRFWARFGSRFLSSPAANAVRLRHLAATCVAVCDLTPSRRERVPPIGVGFGAT